MRVAIISCGLLDTMLPLVRYLSKFAEVDLYIHVYGNMFTDALGTFDLKGQPYGMISESNSTEILGRQLSGYVKNDTDRVRIRMFRYPDLKILNKKNYKLNRRFARHLNNEKYDLVHFNGYRGSLFFIYAFFNQKMGKVWSIHDPIQHSGEFKWPTEIGYRLMRFLKVHIIIHNQTQIPEFISKYKIRSARCHFIRFGPLEVFHIFKNGVPRQTSPHSVLFYGRISPYKGVEYLIEAAKIARESIPDLKVIIAGKPNYPLDLDAIREDNTFEIHDRYIPNHELVKYIQQAELVVCPYTDATQSGVIMTAYAFNKPVLATSVGGIPEMVDDGKTGKLIPPKDSVALAEAMVGMLKDEKLMTSLRENLSFNNPEGKFSWKQIAKHTMDVYQQAVSSD